MVEAGGIIVDCNPPEDFDLSVPSTTPIPAALLGGNKFYILSDDIPANIDFLPRRSTVSSYPTVFRYS